MSYRNQFTASEWQTLQFAPLWIFNLIAGVDGKVERKEVVMLAKELAEAPLYKSDLAKEVFMSVGLDFGTVWPAYQRDGRGIVDGLREVGELVDSKLSSDTAERFKRALIFLGNQILEGSGRGLFGRKDKSKEKAALVLAAIALGIQPD
ncbi:MAG: hypothetical protein ACPLYD_12315 [Anaerolineae bacterium]|uniref:hypothetical protein n=1 Tax=Thermogutta sp. TaxID=1962930 RepID=UPI00321FA310